MPLSIFAKLFTLDVCTDPGYVSYLNGHCVKSVRIRCYSGTHFPAFGLNTGRYSVFLCIQPECGKMWTRITGNADSFYAVGKRCLCPYFFFVYLETLNSLFVSIKFCLV